MIPDDQLNALKDRNPVHVLAAQWVKLRRKRKDAYIGPCPICSRDPQSKVAPRFECDADKWVCAVCADGGDVIRLVMKREGVDFVGAVERLGGTREEVPTPELARKAGLRDFKRAGMPTDGTAPRTPDIYATSNALQAAYAAGWADGRRRASYEVFARDRERRRLYAFWKAGVAIWGTPVEIYLTGRGYVIPPNARLKFHPAMPLFCDGREVEPVLAHTGPAMLAAIRAADGHFSGLHITWLDPSGPKGKARVLHPETGEVLPSKKSRGTKNGGYIDLGGCDPATAARMIAGEGNETVFAAYTALVRAGRDVSRLALRGGIDLGNLAGRALATLAHPTLKTEGGRPQRVGGPDPDLESLAMPVPADLPELILLGDGDSDPFLTRNAMARAKARHEAPGRLVRVAFAPDGLDFDDLLNRTAAPREGMQGLSDEQ